MNLTVNKAILIGNLGKDPEIYTFEGGNKKASFSLATTEYYRDANGERQQITEWHNIVCFRGLAEISEKYLKKGMSIYVEGRIKTRSWEDNGSKRYITEIVADSIQMLTTKAEQENIQRSAPQQSSSPQPPTNIESAPIQPQQADEDDDLPF